MLNIFAVTTERGLRLTGRAKGALFVVLGLVALCTPTLVFAQTQVVVGSSGIQPPFVVSDDGSGLTQDLIDAMNDLQNAYEFVHVIVPALRTFESERRSTQPVDILPFGSTDWETRKFPKSQSSLVLMRSADVFFARDDAPSGIFEDILSRKMAVVLGYSYAALDYELDPDKLKDKAQVMFANDEVSVVELVIHDRAEIGIADSAVLDWFKSYHPDEYKQIRICDEPDKSFPRQFILLENAPISVSEFNDILMKLRASGVLDKIFSSFGLPSPPLTLE